MPSSYLPYLTYPAILVAVFARQMWLPIPAVLFLMMAGALGESGKLSLPAIILTGVVGYACWQISSGSRRAAAGAAGFSGFCAASARIVATVPRGLEMYLRGGDCAP